MGPSQEEGGPAWGGRGRRGLRVPGVSLGGRLCPCLPSAGVKTTFHLQKPQAGQEGGLWLVPVRISLTPTKARGPRGVAAVQAGRAGRCEEGALPRSRGPALLMPRFPSAPGHHPQHRAEP